MRYKSQVTLDAILQFVNKYYHENRMAPTISDIAAGVGIGRTTAYRYLQELSERGLLDCIGRLAMTGGRRIMILLQGNAARRKAG